MPRLATTWVWIVAVAAVAGGCSTFDLDGREDERGIDALDERPAGGPANRPASLESDAESATVGDGYSESSGAESSGAESGDGASVFVRASDTDAMAGGAASGTAGGTVRANAGQLESSPGYRSPHVRSQDYRSADYRSAGELGSGDRGPRDVAGASPGASNGMRAADSEETFDQLMAEARRRGALSATEEASFRRDLADVPAHLRPQMAAMLLAVRGRREEPAAAGSPVAGSLDSGSAMPVVATAPGANAAATTSERLARIAARTPAATSLDDNPLRALVAAAESTGNKRATAAGSGAATAPRIASSMALSASNQPGEIGASGATVGAPAKTLDATKTLDKQLPTYGERGATVTRATAASEAATRETAARRGWDAASLEEWQVMLGATIRSLEAKLAASPDDKETPRRQAFLRLLYLAANRLEDTAKAMPADGGEQQFWIDWLYGTSVYLDAEATPNDAQRAAIAADRLREAVHRLGERANLLVSNVAFCRRVTSFGVYEPFAVKPGAATCDFVANQEVLLYAEVRNFTSVPTAKGQHTLLRPSYQIFDAQGRRLGAVVELDESHDYCQSPRTDFFVCYHIYLPTRIDPGEYKLKLTIEDVHGGKVHENSVDFAIKRG